jgi:4-amino-4-deoxy-L-arabinose transferase-like glycosyltransferase
MAGRPLSQLVDSFGNLFRITAPLERDVLLDRLMLLAIMIVGAYVRFATLAAVGLHGDEETMGLAVKHILQDGRPILPSGMFYPRGITELYLMAMSAKLFGVTEWALRLPSAVCGVILIPLSYLAGKRFLRPRWRLALAGCVALLPEIVEYSQTARMYIFLLVSVTFAMLCVFEWERTGKTRWLIACVCAFALGLDYQALAVTVVLLFAFPGLIQRDLRKLVAGAAAAFVVCAVYVAVEHLVSAQYPPSAGRLVRELAQGDKGLGFGLDHHVSWSLIATAIAAALGLSLSIYVARAARVRIAQFSIAALFVGGLIAQAVLFYHIAAICYVAAVVVALRFAERPVLARLVLFMTLAMALCIVHVVVLAPHTGTPVKLIGAMIGRPSVWPYVRALHLSEVAGLLLVGGMLLGLWQFAQQRRAADVWLLSLLTAWIPIFALGFFTWNMPPRYAAASLMPMLLCAVAFAQLGVDKIRAQGPRTGAALFLEWIAPPLATVLIVGPHGIANAGASYAHFPDHAGAAAFLRSQNVTSDDFVLAEDVLEQQYYLGVVDYWLIGPRTGMTYSTNTPSGLRDIYTGTPVLSSAAELTRLIRQQLAAGKRVFIIGSGEDQSDGRRFARGDELYELLESNAFKTIYLGRDRLTRVIVPDANAPTFNNAPSA